MSLKISTIITVLSSSEANHSVKPCQTHVVQVSTTMFSFGLILYVIVNKGLYVVNL